MNKTGNSVCPICGCQLNPENLSRHLSRIHPDSSVEGRSAFTSIDSKNGNERQRNKKKAKTDGPYIEYNGQVTVNEYGIVENVHKASTISRAQPRRTPRTVIPSTSPEKKKSAVRSTPIESRSIDPETSCPICAEVLDASLLAHHLKQHHQIVAVVRKTSAKGPNQAVYQCLYCQVHLRTSEVVNHKARCPNKKPETPRAKVAKQPRAVSGDILCGVCNRYVHPDHISDHVKKYHRKVPFIPAKTGQENFPNPRYQNPRVERPKTISTRKKHETDDHMDGSKDLGHLRRESNGQFGSFPLHDDYSEESGAD